MKKMRGNHKCAHMKMQPKMCMCSCICIYMLKCGGKFETSHLFSGYMWCIRWCKIWIWIYFFPLKILCFFWVEFYSLVICQNSKRLQKPMVKRWAQFDQRFSRYGLFLRHFHKMFPKNNENFIIDEPSVKLSSPLHHRTKYTLILKLKLNIFFKR